MTTRTSFLLLSALCVAGELWAETEPAPLPEAYKLERYAKLMERAIFTPPSAAPAKTQEELPSFAADLYVVGLAKLGGKNFVTIATKNDRETGFSLMEGEEHDGISLASVEHFNEIGKSKVTLKKGTEFGTIGFDEALIQEPAAPEAQPGGEPGGQTVVRVKSGQPLRPGAPGVQPGGRRPGLPGNPMGRRRAIIPGAPGQITAPGVGPQIRNRSMTIPAQPSR